jgi:hypothetical protein
MPTLLRSLIPLLILSGLAIDQLAGPIGQPVVVVATLVLFLTILARESSTHRVMMLVCLLYASIGEVLLSIVWRVYDYRLGNLPLFVPPGHVLLFLLGMSIAPHVRRAAVIAIAIGAAGTVAFLALTGRDTLSVLLVSVFLGCVVFGRERQLYATMFVLALAMELYGTWLGNWHWNAHVSRTGMVTLNPPVAAGAFYCALDLLVMLTMRALGRSPTPIVPVPQPVQL